VVSRLALAFLLISTAYADQASDLYKEARRLEKDGDDLRAYAVLTRVIGIRPQEKKYQLAAEKVRVRAAQSLAALGQFQTAQALDPANRYMPPSPEAASKPGDVLSDSEIHEAERALPPPELRPTPGLHSFNLKGDSKAVYEQVFRAYGLEVVFDSEFTPGPPIRFQIDEVDFRDALHALMSVTNAFVAPLHERVGLVAKDTQQKRTELEPVMEQLLPIPQATTVEEANEVGRAVQQALDIRRLSVDATRRQVLVRDTVTKVQLARALYEELSRTRGEVLLDVSLVAVSRQTIVNLGLVPPTADVPITAGQHGNVPLGGGQTLFGIELVGTDFTATGSRSESRLLSNFQLRTADGLPATMHIGERYPVANAIFTSSVITPQIQSSQQNGQYIQPFPSINFEDLGLSFKATAKIHDSREVSLSLEAEFRSLAGQSSNGVPVIADRKFITNIRVREGETSVISGLTTGQISRTLTGLPGIAQIPFIGLSFGKRTWDIEDENVLLTITPHLMIPPPGEQGPVHALYCGSETRLVSPL
jgi:hypothetical protein